MSAVDTAGTLVRLTRPSSHNGFVARPQVHQKRITASVVFWSTEGASKTIESYEAMHAIRKGQVRWLIRDDVIGLRHFIPPDHRFPSAICNRTRQRVLIRF